MNRLSPATGDVLGRLEFAGQIAREAGERILGFYGDAAFEVKAGGSPVTAADLASNEYLVTAIGARHPGEAILAEESADSGARLGQSAVWVVDPLDGTKEFLSRNGEFSVMVGFVDSGEPVVGVVYVPARRLLYGAALGHGAWVEDGNGGRRALRCVRAGASLRLVGSRSHADALVGRMRDALGIRDERPSGSVGIKCALIAEGERDLYIHPVPYLKEWDTCAPELIVREAGGTVTDCLGARLRYNKPDPVQPDGIVASGVDVHERVMAVVRPLYEQAKRERVTAADRRSKGGA